MDVGILSWEQLSLKIGLKEVNNELNKRMKQVYDELQELASLCVRDESLTTRLFAQRQIWLPARDEYQRNVLHLAALKGNTKLVRCLVYSGGQINETDGIGQTPLTLAMHKEHIGIAKWLIEHGASIEDEDFSITVSPLQIASVKENLVGLEEIIQNQIKKNADIKKHVSQFYAFQSQDLRKDCEMPDSSAESVNFCRFMNINVGDQKNTANIQGCVNRCPDVYSSHTPGGGDFHNRGYLNESIARVAGHGGFWHVVESVMKRPTINQSSFKKKFKDNNYNNNEEALLDYDDGLSIAMIKQFELSDYFPTKEELKECYTRNKSHNEILMRKFKDWVAHCEAEDEQFAYQNQVVNKLMPITRWYKESIRNGNGISVEGVWMLCPPLYAQTGKTNYRDESFTMLCNALAKWPVAYRKMYQQNRTVNLGDKEGRQIAGDEWVEGYLVAPVKRYAKAQTSFPMLEMMSSSVNVLEMNRQMYKNREAFDIHRTRRHHTPSSFYDQLRVAQFALKEEWFVNKGRKSAKCYSWAEHACKAGETVPKKYLKALEKGDEKAESEFLSFRHRKYPNDMK